jgi:hypothetical protein
MCGSISAKSNIQKGGLAQLVARKALIPKVPGSIPAGFIFFRTFHQIWNEAENEAETKPKRSRNEAEAEPKRSRNEAETKPKRSRNGAETKPKRSRNDAETKPKRGRNEAETKPKRGRNEAETKPRTFLNSKFSKSGKMLRIQLEFVEISSRQKP